MRIIIYNDAMNKLFIYFSWTGNGEFLTSELKGYEPHKVEMKKPLKKMNFFRIFRYGFLAGTQKKVPIKEMDLNLSQDDQVVIGSPIWNDRLCNPILTLLSKYDFNKETTQFVLYSGGGKADHAKVQLEKLGFKKEPIILKQPLQNEEATKDALKNL